MTRDPEFDPEHSALLLPTSSVGCRIALFATSLRLVLRDLGYPNVPILSPRVSMDTDDVGAIFGVLFMRKVFRGMLGIELLSRKLSETRPYELTAGESDKAFEDGVEAICRGIREGDYWRGLTAAAERFDRVALQPSEQRPIIGLLGDDYTRANTLANNNVIREIEALGGEVWNVAILSTFMKFQRSMKPRKMLKQHRFFELGFDLAKSALADIDTARICGVFKNRLKCYPDPTFDEIMDSTSKYLDRQTEPLVIMALAHAIHLVKHGVDGLVNVIGFQCMIYNIITACLKDLCEEHGRLPTLNLYCDFQERIHHRNRMEAFMYQVRQYRQFRR